MKTNDMFKLIVAGIIFSSSLIFGYILLFPSEKSESDKQESLSENVKEIPSDIDEKTYESLKKLDDYGSPQPIPEELGKLNIFTSE